MGLRRETKADGPFVVGGIMVDEAIEEGDVGSVGRSTEGSGRHKVMRVTQGRRKMNLLAARGLKESVARIGNFKLE
jgi:hypothetical protein